MALSDVEFKLGAPQLRTLFKGVVQLVSLVAKKAHWKLTDDEAEALTAPAARMLHGRKKIQAVIQKTTDPGLFAGAALAIVESRLRGSSGSPSATPARSSPAPAPPRPAVAAERPLGTEWRRGTAEETAPANPQDVDLSNLRVDAASADAVLADLQASVMSLG